MNSEIMAWAVFAGPLMLAVLFLIFIARLRSKKESRVDISRYSLKESVMSLADVRFYKVLSEVVGTKYDILVKPQFEDLFEVSNGKDFETAQGRLVNKRLDYVFCDPVTYEPLMGINMVEQPEQTKIGKSQEKFENSLYVNTGLKILRVPVARAYRAEDLRDQIIAVFRENGGK